MAESKFLKYQDKTGDGLIDACDDVIEVAEVPCEDYKCVENGNALTPTWWQLDNEDSFLNEKNCLYQVVIDTKYTTILDDAGNDALGDRYDEYARTAIDVLLDVHDKDSGAAAVRAMAEILQYTDYYLAPRSKSRLRLLYSVPYSDLATVDASDDEEDSGATDEDSDVEVTYEIQDLKAKLVRVRKGLHLYGMYLRVYRSIDNGNLFYQNGDLAGKVFPLFDYGDMGVLGGSTMAKLLPQLDKFLNTKGLNIRGVAGSMRLSGDKVKKLTFTFSGEYELKKLLVYTETCGEIPIVFIKKLSYLKKKSAWKDPTALAYLAKLDDMERDLTAREPVPWSDFVKTHTYPTIYSSVNQGYANTDPESSIASCVAEALQNEAKQLGQDILDSDFSIGDAIAYQFHKSLCREKAEETIQDEIDVGLLWSPKREPSNEDAPAEGTNNSPAEENPERKVLRALSAMAAEQAGQTIGMDDATFDEFCDKVISDSVGMDLEDLWAEGFSKIKLCGLYSMLTSSIKCLFSGLTLEEALSTVAESALRSMSLENFGDLFIGLPPEKQAELDALVKQKFESGEFLGGGASYTKPWEDEELVEDQKENQMKSGATGETQVAITPIEPVVDDTRRTLAKQLDFGSAAKKELDPNNVFEAYILALIEVYSENYFELLEELNKFPGAQLIANIIATLDCPIPPILEPSMLEFIKDVQLPFCQNTNKIGFPALQNPFGWIPVTKDITGALWIAIEMAIQEAIVTLLMKMMVKICGTLGSLQCTALEAGLGAAGAGAGIQTGRTSFADIIKDAICGDDADAEQVDDTIADMFASLGTGAAALADTEQVTSFTEDLSSAVTRAELSNAFLGDCSPEFLTIADTLIEYEYPDFRAGLRNKESICTFFGDMGNLMPSDFKDQLRDFAENLPLSDQAPANPSLCLTEQQVEDFCALRTEILEGRATEDQIAKLCERPVDDLKDLANVLQNGLPTDQLPPLVSDPGCDNGLIPFETEEMKATATGALSGILEQLKVDFAYDMLGNGPGEGRWGFINMILSDTMGNPLTAHMRKVSNRRAYVDFYTDSGATGESKGGWFDPDDSDDIIVPKQARTARQKGAFPYKIADWLEEYMQTELTATFSSNNEFQKDIKSQPISFEDASITTFGGGLNLLKLPELGYNVGPQIDFENEEIVYLEKGRKKDPDLTLSFHDNCKGLYDEDEVSKMYSYGFDLDFYLSDLVSGSADGVHNRYSDNVRIKVTDRNNISAKTDTRLAASIPEILKYLKPLQYKVTKAILKPDNTEIVEVADKKIEFLAADNILDEIDLTPYPKFISAFDSKQQYLPQIILLDEIIGAGTISMANIKSSHDEIMSAITQDFIDLVANNEDAFLYGATYDDLSFDDVEYVVDDGQTNSAGGTNYYEAEVDDDEGGTRKIRNDDQIMGISKMQYEDEDKNRVIYLDPGTFGGSYMNPPLYIKPVENKGWLGFMDVIFPELSPCKPYRTDLIDFEDINQKIEDSYPTIPEDERLKSDPDCVVEVPYARILERSAASGLESIITSAIRIYVSTYFLKSIATFTKFKPSFPDVFSSLYASYIVEEMEASFKDAQKAFWEFFNPFKDTKFWYAFLEQSVQLYSRRIDNGEISDPPAAVVDALVRLNNVQENYVYPYKNDLKKARADGEAGLFETLKKYRENKNLEAVQATEEDAKMVLKELVVEQLNYMGKKFVKNLKIVGMKPEIYDLSYYVLQNLSQGGEGLTLDKEIEEEYQDLPTEGDEYYTNGGELASSDGTTYVGYYHVEKNEEGYPIYVTGEFETDRAPGQPLTPFANKITVPIGDIEELGATIDTDDTSRPFVIQKYISIDGTARSPSSAVDKIKSISDQNQNISDVYPGDLELVTDTNGRVVGITGELGVRHGLRFYAIIDGTKTKITDVEVDALDRPLSQIDPLEGDSKLLLCLINLLKKDDKFRLATEYIFPLNKIVATLAIYNGLAFMPSIGEKMVKDNQTVGKWYWGEADDLPKPSERTENTIYTKPGVALTFDAEGQTAVYPPNYAGPDTEATTDSVTITDADGNNTQYDLSRPNGGGWTSKLDRDPGLFGGLFVKEWDNWDQTLLRNSKSRIKKIFKGYYNSRDFSPTDSDDSGDSPGTIITSEFRERFKPRPGQNLLPFWKKRMLRTNPFNASGEMCEEKD